MPKPPSVSVRIDVNPGSAPLAERPEPETPFRVLLMGDFSGRAHRGEMSPPNWKPVLVDRDNFDEVLARFWPELSLGGASARVLLRFHELDDFHPDRIFQYNPVFRNLRERRAALLRGELLPETEVTLQATGEKSAEAVAATARPPLVPPGGSLLDSIIAGAESRTPAKEPAREDDSDDLRAFIRQSLTSETVAAPDPRAPARLAQLDASAGALMRGILHDPSFQALEAVWRSVFLLTRRLDTGTQLKIYIVDVTSADLTADVNGSTSLQSSALHRLLVAQGGRDRAWSLVAGDFSFTSADEDALLLTNLAGIMRAAEAPFLGEARFTESVATESGSDWDLLRRSFEASWIALLLPRFLLRLPYGKETDSIEAFPFEEMAAAPVHREYLWGNPAFAGVWFLAKAFSMEGWDFRPGRVAELSGLPLHVYECEDEHRIQPCAEMLMSEREAEAVLDQGFTPLLSVKNRDSIRLLRVQSIANPPAPLSGRWS